MIYIIKLLDKLSEVERNITLAKIKVNSKKLNIILCYNGIEKS